MDMYNNFFEWIIETVDGYEYREVLSILYETEFYPVLPQDENRLIDGRDLIYRFGDECDIPSHILDNKLGGYCSVLEMMVGLAIRIEETIMEDIDFGNRTSMWFWIMMKSLGLYEMKDDKVDKNIVESILIKFLNREYSPNGEGGLFTVNDTNNDLREVEIWYQMCMFFDKLL